MNLTFAGGDMPLFISVIGREKDEEEEILEE